MTHDNNDVAITPEHPDVIAQAEATGSNPASIATALRLTRARHEMQALKEWQRTRQGPEPAIPNLNSIREGITMKSKTNKRTSSSNGTTRVTMSDADVLAIVTDVIAAGAATKGAVVKAFRASGHSCAQERIGAIAAPILASKPSKPVTKPSAASQGNVTTKAKASNAKQSATTDGKQVAKTTTTTVTTIGKQTAASKALGQRRDAKVSAKASTPTKRVATKVVAK